MARKATGARTYIVRLDAEERSTLEGIIRRGHDAAGRLLKARILLKADASECGEKWHDSRIAEALETSLTTIWRVRQAYVEQGLEAAISRKKRQVSSNPAIFDGEAEARLIQLACSEPPPGHARWSLRLLEKHVVALDIVATASDSTIGRVLQKTSSSLTLNNNGLSRRVATAPS